MKDERDLETRLAAWLHAAAPAPTPGLADRLLRRTGATHQRRAWSVWAVLAPALGAAAAVIVAVVLGLQLLGVPPGPPPVGSQPTIGTPATPTAVSSPSTSPTDVSSQSVSPTDVSSPSTPAAASTEPALSQSCPNATDGYTVDYPADWFANDEIQPRGQLDGVPACRYFAPRPFEALPNAGVPPTVAIGSQLVPEPPLVIGTLLSSRTRTVDGRAATAREYETGEGAFMLPGTLVYEYLIALDGGGFLLAGTDSTRDGDYAEHKRVLDLMLQTLEFTP